MNHVPNAVRENTATDSSTAQGMNVRWEFAASENRTEQLESRLRLADHNTDFSHENFLWKARRVFETEPRYAFALLSASTDDPGSPADQHGSRWESIQVYVIGPGPDRRVVSRRVDTGVEFAISTSHPMSNDAWIDEIEHELVTSPTKHPLVAEFERGVPTEPKPVPNAVSMANRLVVFAESNSKASEFSVDVDGGISFTIAAIDGTLISGELTTNGKLYAWQYEPDWSTQRAEIIGEEDTSNLHGWLG